MPWRTGLDKGFYADKQCSMDMTPPHSSVPCTGMLSGCGDDMKPITTMVPNDPSYSQEQVLDNYCYSQDYVNEKASVFYDPSFDEGMPPLAPIKANARDMGQCDSQPKIKVWSYPNDINSLQFRKQYGYGN